MTGSAGHNRARRLLVISETALAFVLLMGAGLMLRSFQNLQHVNPGMRTDHIVTFHLRLPTDTLYKQRSERAEFYRKVVERVNEIPGVQSAGLTNVLPMSQEASRESFAIEGRPVGPEGEPMADFRSASPAFFQTMGIPLLRGRLFTAHDDANAKQVALIDETMARRYFANEDPIGKRLHLFRTFEIVGVAGAVRHYGLDKPPRPTIYVPLLQAPGDRVTLAVRSGMREQAVVNAVKRAVWSVDKDQPVFLIRSMDDYVRLANSALRIALALLGVFAALAIALAALGIYSVVSYTVSQRSHEFGVRIALGASARIVRRSIIRDGLRIAAVGLAAGFAGVLLLAPLLRLFLYGVATVDISVAAAACLFLLAVAALANYLPATRATRVDPMEALRYE